MIHYAEKRNFPRMLIDCPADLLITGSSNPETVIIKNLSSSGLLMVFNKEINPETQLTVKILPGSTTTPPFSAEASVRRCYPCTDGFFNIACSIDRILEEETGPDSPAGSYPDESMQCCSS